MVIPMNKTILLSSLACLAVGAAIATSAATLEAHEWGTFTVLAGSDGAPLRWYQSEQSIAELPGFVLRSPMPGKGGRAYYVRMETPVIYFYPDQPTPVSVQVRFPQGLITEHFPARSSARFETNGTYYTDVATWEGALVSPRDAAAAGRIPSLAGQRGAHYGHAREVPAAWIFHATNAPSNLAHSAQPPPAEPWEKFIFYRGACDTLPPLSAYARDDRTIVLQRTDTDGTPTVAFALQVDRQQARWARLPNLDGTGFAMTAGAASPVGYPRVSVRLEDPFASIELAASELAAAMTPALIEAGLTPEEAKAMVATWRDVWFREPGTRVLALLPRPWVDSAVPLEISPPPRNLTRVFVGRFELFTPSRENALLALLDLDPPRQPGTQLTDAFRSLELGRFAAGALQRVQDLQIQRSAVRFQKLQSTAAP
jgi:hypothetical protein